MSGRGGGLSAREWQRWEREQAEAAGLAEAQRKTAELTTSLNWLWALFSDGLRAPVRIEFEAMKEPRPSVATYVVAGGWGPMATAQLDRAPVYDDFRPPLPSRIERLIPGWQQRYQQREKQAEGAYLQAQRAWAAHEQRLAEIEQQHRRVEEIRANYRSAKPAAVREALSFALSARTYPRSFPHKFSMVYKRPARQLIIEYEFPDFGSAVPALRAVEYQKTKRMLKDVPLGVRERQQLYRHVLASVTLLTLHDVFTADTAKVIDRVAFIGIVDTIDRATGQPIRPVLISLEAFRETFSQLNLSLVEPIPALQGLKASVSTAPTELKPVDPVIEIDLSDPLKVEEEEVLSSLSINVNLIDLNPYRFETLIRDLFERMGYQTYKRQDHRDGGVDCVAWFQEPAGRRKSIIQAKRTSKPVQVSAVRDLLGAMQKERAGTGILVTTSRFSRGAYQFAQGEQLMLWEGPQLLAMLREHVGKEFTIKLPQTET